MTDLAHDTRPPSSSAQTEPAETDSVPRPAVSLCVPAYQAQQHLPATIESLLAQDFDDFEIVIVDNHSSDGTAQILSSIADKRVRVVRNESTLPIIDNFNAAVNLCRGEFVKLVCADDILDPSCIAAQSEILRQHPDVALVGAQTDFIDGDGALLRPARGLRGIAGRRRSDHVVRRLVRSGTNPIGAPVATMFRRSDFVRCGGFRDDPLFYSDADMWVRLLQHGDFYGIPRSLAAFRFGNETVSATLAARSQLAQQGEFTRRLSTDKRWGITRRDLMVGRLNAYDKQLRRVVLFAISKRRGIRREQVARQQSNQ